LIRRGSWWRLNGKFPKRAVDRLDCVPGHPTTPVHRVRRILLEQDDVAEYEVSADRHLTGDDAKGRLPLREFDPRSGNLDLLSDLACDLLGPVVALGYIAGRKALTRPRLEEPLRGLFDIALRRTRLTEPPLVRLAAQLLDLDHLPGGDVELRVEVCGHQRRSKSSRTVMRRSSWPGGSPSEPAAQRPRPTFWHPQGTVASGDQPPRRPPLRPSNAIDDLRD
jgi:hypothetical protein